MSEILKIDEEANLELLGQPPESLLKSLKIPSETTVSSLLDIPKDQLPTCPNSRKIFLPSNAWFTEKEPNAELPHTVSQFIIPPPARCMSLGEQLLREAVERGHKSVQHPVKDGVFLPLSAVVAWSCGNTLLEGIRTWTAKLKWVERSAEAEQWPENLRRKTKENILRVPWQSGLSMGKRYTIPIKVVAEKMLSREWMTGDNVELAIQSILQSVKLRHFVAEPTLCVSLRERYLEKKNHIENRVDYFGRKLEDGSVVVLDIPWNLERLHWFHITVNIEEMVITVADTAPDITRPYLDNILDCVILWLHQFVPRVPDWKTVVHPIPIQKDSFSCGAAMLLDIWSRACVEKDDIRHWEPGKPMKARARLFNLIIDTFTVSCAS
ncbi:hypothetical protein BT96DRAFT_334376 [Gymnopus androsaceus JB14]|uniref:Ubiquitin-like protease family profile domain-containing protein n=1 Tax=Gymnopus androsaceus JB14 TaxID=1447944 RepID=A0A6A4GFR0_9AGAR|nr:hypothetical protein BT96DRAFT_677780 [Gymnopus androsaceus JB14]KAE9390749.1 hypothetical protein BT96DRAFT_334376 [Gymnopus androsaceus JB14]